MPICFVHLRDDFSVVSSHALACAAERTTNLCVRRTKVRPCREGIRQDLHTRLSRCGMSGLAMRAFPA
jgi:hypothetical protein